MKIRSDFRSPIVRGDIAEIQLTRGYVAIIDASDLHLVANKNWSASQGGTGGVYAVSGFENNGKWTTRRIHRVILGMSGDDPRDVDHEDLNTLNNRRSNLRICTRSQNEANKIARKDSGTGVKGVFLHKSGKFRAKIKINGVQTHLGYFHSKVAAKSAYNQALIKLHGSFSRA